jgi:hypothetical protein
MKEGERFLWEKENWTQGCFFKIHECLSQPVKMDFVKKLIKFRLQKPHMAFITFVAFFSLKKK